MSASKIQWLNSPPPAAQLAGWNQLLLVCVVIVRTKLRNGVACTPKARHQKEAERPRAPAKRWPGRLAAAMSVPLPSKVRANPAAAAMAADG